mmetsp:Transcript_14300/g.40675  ORF Transcript_14300/g.40675 Transcript_14300/m.40675 type:complete len:797 (+) Transcript_14300:90-2480(+)
MMNLFDLCCGGDDEQRKLSAVTDPFSDAEEEELKHVQSEQNMQEHIRHVEHQISSFNKARNTSRNTIISKPLCSSKTCSYEAPKFEKSDDDRQFLMNHLNENFLFEDLVEAEKMLLVDAMQVEEASEGTVIFNKDDDGNFFYICQEGKVEYFDDDIKVGSFAMNNSFGELALLCDSKRTATCKAVEDVKLWKVDQQTFRYIIAHNAHKQTTSLKDLIRQIEMFKDLDETILTKFVNSLVPIGWKAGERIVKKGQEGNIFYIVIQGQVRIHDIGLGDSQYDDQVLDVGGSFGERALLTGEPRAANVTAVTDVTTMAIDRDTFEDYFGKMQNLMERNMRKQFLTALPLIKNSRLMEPEIDQLVDAMTELCYRKGQFLAKPGEPYGMNLWIIRHGTLLVYSSKHPENIYNLQSGDYFGDKSIRGDPSHISSHTAVCEENLTTWVLTRADIEHIIGDIARLGNSMDFAKSKQDRSIVLSQLQKHRILGQGAFGRVWLVSHKSTKSTYALKVISKHKLVQQQQVQSVLREKDMLCLLQHPFILHLVANFQDEANLYLLLPVIQGGELYSRLQKSAGGKGLPSKDAAFYAACIMEALGHFHQRRIAYRDLKLENVLLDADGYCIIVDLGFAKVVADKTFTLVGTPEYLAPEVIMSKGHNHAADYWSYGVLVYELLCGMSPFYQKNSTQMEMFKRIVLVKYDMPAFVNATERQFIEELLVRKQTNRLGNMAEGTLAIKRHQFFQETGVNFKSIHKKEMVAPWKPDVKENSLDLSDTFDDYSSLKEEIYYNKLHADDQALFASF